jgi:Flp pilus assembly protein TadG
VSNSANPAAAGIAGDRRGVVAVEFALVGLIFIMLLLGATELARYQFVQQSLRSMAEEAARRALVTSSATAVLGGGCQPVLTGASLVSAVTSPTNPTPMLTPGSLTLAAVCATNASGARTITVTASYPFTFVVPFLPTMSSLSASAAMTY